MASLTQWTWVWANSGRWRGQGSLVCCSPGVATSWTRFSDWTELHIHIQDAVFLCPLGCENKWLELRAASPSPFLRYSRRAWEFPTAGPRCTCACTALQAPPLPHSSHNRGPWSPPGPGHLHHPRLGGSHSKLWKRGGDLCGRRSWSQSPRASGAEVEWITIQLWERRQPCHLEQHEGTSWWQNVKWNKSDREREIVPNLTYTWNLKITSQANKEAKIQTHKKTGL